MSTSKIEKSEHKLNDNLSRSLSENAEIKQSLNGNIERKPFHQLFTLYFSVIFLAVVTVLSTFLWLLSEQYNFSKSVITEQLRPIEIQLLQQTYLINTNKLVDEIFHNTKANEMSALQQALSLQSKKLSLLPSEHKKQYQQWFISNNDAISLLNRIENNHARYELLRNNTLIQLDTLLDAIEIELSMENISQSQSELLMKVQSQLSTVLTKLNLLNLKTSVEEFEPLRNQIEEMFVEDYAKQLAKQQPENDNIMDIVRDFIRFEDLILKQGLMLKWQDQLGLMAGYQKGLVSQKALLNNVLDSLVETSIANSTSKSHDISTALPRWILIVFTFSLLAIVGFLWLIRSQLKMASQVNESFIRRAVHNESEQQAKDQNSFIARHKRGFYSAESARLVAEIQEINANSYSAKEYLAMTEENNELEKALVNEEVEKERLKLELELIEFNTLGRSERYSLIEHHRCKVLQVTALKQLAFLGASAISSNVKMTNEKSQNAESNYLYSAYLHGKSLVKQLSEASCYRYLQSSDAVLTLSDVDLAAQIQAVLLNLRNELLISNNQVLVTIDDNIHAGVNLDADLFSEMFRVFTCLLLTKQKNKQLEITLQLVDKNNGQQKIIFSGQVQSDEEKIQLPQVLNNFNNDSEEGSEFGDYFRILLRFQHGDEVSTKLIEQGYQLSFTLPLAVQSNQQEDNYSVFSLPSQSSDLATTSAKLALEYNAMPIEVLLAVKEPEKYLRMQELLQAVGLQVTFIACELMLQKYWQLGRYAILITELECQPFTSFMINELEKPSGKNTFPRGVFSLAKLNDIQKRPEDYEHWLVGELDSQSSADELIATMSPWLQAKSCSLLVADKSESITSQNSNDELKLTENECLEVALQFDFNRYLKHQGSTELALFMLDEYTNENSMLLMELSLSFENNDSEMAETAIKALIVNSKILAADSLLSLCQRWLTLLTNQGLDNTNKAQKSLLSNIKESVEGVNQDAETIA